MQTEASLLYSTKMRQGCKNAEVRRVCYILPRWYFGIFVSLHIVKQYTRDSQWYVRHDIEL